MNTKEKNKLKFEASVWRLIAEWIGRYGLFAGLCREVGHVYFEPGDPDVGGDMMDRLYGHMHVWRQNDFDVHSQEAIDLGLGVYFEAPGVADVRILACLLMALECEDEANATI